jgi:hypothetical protein
MDYAKIHETRPSRVAESLLSETLRRPLEAGTV